MGIRVLTCTKHKLQEWLGGGTEDHSGAEDQDEGGGNDGGPVAVLGPPKGVKVVVHQGNCNGPSLQPCPPAFAKVEQSGTAGSTAPVSQLELDNSHPNSVTHACCTEGNGCPRPVHITTCT